jgi:hypothetical protein
MYLLRKEEELHGATVWTNFGPFPTEERAMKYAESFENAISYEVEPLIVPNCVTVRTNY